MGLHDRLSRNGDGTITVVEGADEFVVTDPYADLKAKVHHACIAKLGPELFKQDPDDLADRVYRAVTEELTLEGTPLTREERRELVRQLTDDILGYGPIEPLLRDDSVTEVMVNGYDKVYVERSGKLERTSIRFVDDAHLMRIIDKIVSSVGRRIDEASPMVDARLPDGSRVNAIIPPLSLRGPSLTIRKFSRDPYTMNDLISFGSISPKAAQFLSACVKGKLNVLISGGTGTGKTTTLNALSAFVPGDERIVTIEDAAELQLQQEHVITLESRPPNIEGQGEIRIRELVHHPCELPARRALEARDARADGRRRAPPPCDPGADRERVRPARPDRAPRRRLAPDHAHQRGARHGVRRDHVAGHLHRQAAGRGGRGRRPRRTAAAAVEVQRAQAALPREDGRERGRDGTELLRRRRRRERPGDLRGAELRRLQMIRRSLLVVAFALCALALAAVAAAGVQIRGLDPGAYPTLRLSVVTSSPSGRAPHLTENGNAVAGLDAQDLGREKSVVLAVDRSRSMAGASLTNALAAARAFVAAKGQRDRISIVAFGHRALSLTRFSSATIDSDGALRDLVVDSRQGTALYDAVVLASHELDAESQAGRVIILLTDGHDVSSVATLEQAVKAAEHAGAAVYPIAIASRDATLAPLEQIASRTGGHFYRAASSRTLASIYRSIATELSRTWRVEYVTAARPGDSLHLKATVIGFGSAESSVEIPGNLKVDKSAKPSGLFPRRFYSSALGSLLIALAVGVDVLLIYLLISAAQRGSWVRKRLEPHLNAGGRAKQVQKRERFALAAGVFKATEQAFGNFRQWHSLQRLLQRGDVPLRTVEFVYIAAASSIGFGLIAAVTAASTLAILLAFVIGALIPYLVIWIKARRRLKAFENQLPDLLITLAATLKAGHSFRHGIQTVVDEGQDPAAGEFRRVLTETSLGRPMDDALAEMSDRLGSKNFEFTITAVTIQRQVGGSLAGLFDMVAETVRQRQQFARKIRSLTAMGRMSAYVLVGLPFFIAAALTFLNASYMRPLWHEQMGHLLLGLCLVMMTVGSLILKKIVSFRG
jgi:Flp pilus assembly protein TadB